jgi:hypothetical protein
MHSLLDQELLNTHLTRAATLLPGPDYLTVLGWIHSILRPRAYVEIGVRNGDSLRAALPGTTCIGIDPAPALQADFPASPMIFEMTSDQFFETVDVSSILNMRPISLAFIDGLHLFEQSLRDFINLEKFAGPESVIAIHDCIPLDDLTSARERTTDFYTGDIWKLPVALREHRPELHISIIRTCPTGLCIVRHLDPSSKVLQSSYQNIVSKYVPIAYSKYLESEGAGTDAVNNSFDSVKACLAAVGI